VGPDRAHLLYTRRDLLAYTLLYALHSHPSELSRIPSRSKVFENKRTLAFEVLGGARAGYSFPGIDLQLYCLQFTVDTLDNVSTNGSLGDVSLDPSVVKMALAALAALPGRVPSRPVILSLVGS